MSPFLGIMARIMVGIAIHRIKTLNMCNNTLPGIDRMLLGVDITKLDLGHDYSVDHEDGFTTKFLDLTCKEGKSWKSPYDGIRYDVPDQVNDVTSLPSGLVYSETHLDIQMEEVRKSMSEEAGIDTVTEGLFSASLSYKHSQSMLTNTSRFFASSKAFQSTAEIQLIPPNALQSSLNQYTLNMIQQFPDKYEDNPELYEEFIETYGTHYYASGFLGGSLIISFDIEKSYRKTTSDDEVKRNAEATFFDILKAHGAYEGDVSIVTEEFKRASHNTERYYGGMANLFDKEGYSKWWPTVAGNPWLYGGKLRPVTDLLPKGTKRDSLIKATEIYLLKAFLKESKRTAFSFMGRGYLGEGAVAVFLKVADELLNSTFPKAVDVLALGRNISDYVITPEWVSKTQYCVHWRDPYKGFTNLQCAPMLSKTPDWDMCEGDHIDKDCFRDISFEFPVSYAAPGWWRFVNASSNYSPPVQEYACNFIFFTPPGAPGWLINSQLCFYRDRVPLCARANQWTPWGLSYHKHMVASFAFLGIN